MTYLELLEALIATDEVTLMELLELTSEDLVNTFGDKIEDMKDKLFLEYENDTAD